MFRVRSPLWIVLLLGSRPVFAQEAAGQPAAQATSSRTTQSEDNTRSDHRDQAPNDQELEQQQSTRSDRDLADEIRNAIHEDTTLSPEAHKLKVVSESGQVTIKGTVQSEEERQAIEAKAEAIAGPRKVNNQLTVKLKD